MRMPKLGLAIVLMALIVPTIVNADGEIIGEEIAKRTSEPMSKLQYGIDYTFGAGLPSLLEVQMNGMDCTLNAVACNDISAPCFWVGATSSCRVCETGVQNMYCMPRDGEHCVKTGEQKCGNTQNGNCNGSLQCVGLTGTQNACTLKICG